MPFLPTTGDVQVEDAVLTDIAIARIQSQDRFFAPKLAPFVGVTQQAGKFPVWDAGDLNRDSVSERAPGEEYPIGTLRLSNDSYNCEVYKDSLMIPDEVRRNAVSSVQLDRTYTEALANKFLIKADRAAATALAGTSGSAFSSWDNDDDVGTAWNDESNGTPLTTLKDAVRTLVKQGVPRNRIFGFGDPNTIDALEEHPDFTDKFENTQVSVLDSSHIAQTLKIGGVTRCESVYNSAAENASESMAYIWPDEVFLLMYVPESPGINVPAAAYNFMWTGLSGRNDFGVQIEPYRRGERDADQLKGRNAWDVKLVGSNLGYRFYNTLT